MDIWFYHLQRQPLEAVLPNLLEKCLERGWRAAVQCDAARLQALDDWLWNYAPTSFLPHGQDGKDQPIILTAASGNPNGANIRLFADTEAALQPGDSYDRVIVIFDGNDEAKLVSARGQWTRFKGEGHALTYWQQNENGGWDKKA